MRALISSVNLIGRGRGAVKWDVLCCPSFYYFAKREGNINGDRESAKVENHSCGGTPVSVYPVRYLRVCACVRAVE